MEKIQNHPFFCNQTLQLPIPLTPNPLLPRFVKTFPCVTVYMSSLTNMAIAVDRYRFIVRSQSLQVGAGPRVCTVGNSLLRSATSGP